MKIGLIDVDGHNYPNLPLMKISAYHKKRGDSVEWYEPIFSGHMDKVYMSKVFSYTPDYPYHIKADEIIKGGSGYCIRLEDGKEIYDRSKDSQLPYEIEHIYPDYSLYGITDTAYGFLTRGCPRGCKFCHVEAKEGRKTYKVADLSEFWNGQKKIVLMDANLIACREWKDLMQQLIDSKASVDINQGVDIRMMTEEKAQMFKKLNTYNIHFAWDRYADKNIIVPKFKMFKEITNISRSKLTVYILTNFDTTHEQDLDRIYTVKKLGFHPFVMIYNKDSFVDVDKNGKPICLKPLWELRKTYSMEQIKHFEKCWRLAMWTNNRLIFAKCEKFEDFKR